MRISSRILATLLLASPAATAFAQPAQTLDGYIESAANSDTMTAAVVTLALATPDAEVNSDAFAAVRANVNLLRTDLQVATTSDSPHATSIVEKPGIADLLSLALDRGAITKVTNGTGLTLSTTPYAFFTGFGATDTPERWKNAGWARNLSFSSTFSSTDVTAGDFSSFTSGEVKYIIVGNRSPHDPKLLESVRAELRPTFLVTDTSMEAGCKELWDSDPISGETGALVEMNRWLRENKDAESSAVREKLFEVVKKIELDEHQQDLLKGCVAKIVEGEQQINASLAKVAKVTQDYLDDKSNQFSIATLFVRDETVSDYYTAKLLYGHDFTLMSVNLNGEASWNENSKNPAGEDIRSLRAYSVELGLNSKTFANGRLDGSVAAKWLRNEEEDAKSLVVSEAKLNVHINHKLRLPVTLSYANRETDTVEYGWQVNVGINALVDEVLRRLK